MSVFVKLLGVPAVRVAGAWRSPARSKLTALVYHLAYQHAWVDREKLAYLFWPDVPEAKARGNLRKLLARARALDYTAALEAERTRLRWRVDTDVTAFEQAVAARQLAAASQLYGGDLLQGFSVDATEFESWLTSERATLHETWRKATLAHAADLESSGRHEAAGDALEPLLAADPCDEESRRRHLLMLHRSGRRGEALRTFNLFKQNLHEEFGGEPEQATLELVAQLERTEFPAPVLTLTASPATEQARPGHNLPAQTTPFVGRAREKDRLAEQLADPACRLVSVVAPGGMGKTRLALAVAEAQVGRNAFADGVWFVPFAPVQTAEQMVYAVADALGLSFSGQGEPKAQLLAYLEAKAALLVLDNLEHLLDGVGLVGDLLKAAPNVKVLATSRERLKVQAEWLCELGGLDLATDGRADADALTLLNQAARKVCVDFALTAANRAAALRICRLVEGMPLATELAAAWLGVLSAEEIVREIERGLDILETDMRDVLERQRSVRAVFDTSWKHLSTNEQKVFAALSIFRGGFSRAAAREVAGADLKVLRTLANKSLITAANGRYTMHELLRQYAADKLTPPEEASLKQAHSRYFLHFLTALGADLLFAKQLEAASKVELERENLRAALDGALRKGDAAVFEPPLPICLSIFFQYKSRYTEALAFFTRVVTMLDAAAPTAQVQRALLESLVMQGWHFLRFGRLDEAKAAAARALAVQTGLEPSPFDGTATYPQTALAAVALARGDYLEAENWAEAARRQAEALNHPVNLEVATYYRARAALAQGYACQAEALAKQALELATKTGETWFRAYILNVLGDVALIRHAFEEAEGVFEEVLAIRRKFDDREGMALASNRLGDTAMAQGHFGAAEAYYQTAQQAYESISDYGGLSSALAGLGDAALAKGQLEKARTFLRNALSLSAERPFHRITLRVMVSVAHLLFRLGRKERGAAVVALVQRHPAQDAPISGRLDALLQTLPQKVLTSTQASDLPTLMNRLLEDLA